MTPCMDCIGFGAVFFSSFDTFPPPVPVSTGDDILIPLQSYIVCLCVFRSEPSLSHDLYPRQVQPKHRSPGLLLGHLGPLGDYVRHAGSGKGANTYTHINIMPDLFRIWLSAVAVCL